VTTTLSEFDYHLPPERIAQIPVTPRDASRLLVMSRAAGDLTDTHFNQIGNFLQPGDLLVVNQTRVIPARLYARKQDSGGKVEILLLNRRAPATWEALVGGKGMHAGRRFVLENDLQGEVIEELPGPRRIVRFEKPLAGYLEQIGKMPLPPYIHERLEEAERYQTVYAQDKGSAAAPTAGLHFTPQLLNSLQEKGIGLAKVTLHVGLDTFAPVTEENVSEHEIHSEWRRLSPQAADQINKVKENGGRVIAVGTTSVRTLESAAAGGGRVAAVEGPTQLFILPGYQYKIVDAMITNFHLPKSTLLMLVSAFAGRERVLAAYQAAIRRGYRFYSFGDAMLII